MPLNVFYTMVQESQKWPKTQIKGGPALNRSGKAHPGTVQYRTSQGRYPGHRLSRSPAVL